MTFQTPPLEYYKYFEAIETFIKDCQEEKHIQQVAYSSFHAGITQICFTCGKIRTNIKEAMK